MLCPPPLRPSEGISQGGYLHQPRKEVPPHPFPPRPAVQVRLAVQFYLAFSGYRSFGCINVVICEFVGIVEQEQRGEEAEVSFKDLVLRDCKRDRGYWLPAAPGGERC